MSQLKKMSAILVACAAFGLSAPAFAAPTYETTAEVVAGAPATTSAVTPTATDAAKYAQLEQHSQKQQQFKGGDTVVIAMSGGAFVIALLLVILLI